MSMRVVVSCLSPAAEEVRVAVEVVRPSLAGADPVADTGPAVAVPVEVTVLDVDSGAVIGQGGEGHLDLAGSGRVALDLPAGADVPAEHEPVWWVVGKDA